MTHIHKTKIIFSALMVIVFLIIILFFLEDYTFGTKLIDAWSPPCEYYMKIPWGEKNQITEELCENIPENCAQSGLIFNPEGSRSYYLRSQCYLRLALKTKEEKFCEKVRELKIPV